VSQVPQSQRPASQVSESEVPVSAAHSTDGRFTKGNPGGPGRPRKVVKAAADALDERVAAAAGDLFELALRQADEGNTAALKMLLDRVWPVGRGRPLEIGAPEIKHPRDLLTAMNGVTNAVFSGDATAEEGGVAAKVLQAHLVAIQTFDHEERLTELENETRALTRK
jgi:hypothetical protein